MAIEPGRRLPREQRRAQLLDVAAGTFGQDGYHNTSMDDIAEAAGVSKPVLYQHFPSKHSLYLALVEAACTELAKTIDAALDSPTNRDRVRATIDGFYDFVTDGGPYFRFVFESDLAADPDVRALHWRTQVEIGSAIGAVIASETDLDDQESTLLGISLVGMAQTSARRWRAQHDAGEVSLSAERARELTTILCWRGVAAFPRTGSESD